MKTADDDGLDSAATKNFLQVAQDEQWSELQYLDEDTEEAYDAYHESLFSRNAELAPQLQANIADDVYLDAISAPHFDPIARMRKKPMTRTQLNYIRQRDLVAEARDPEVKPPI